MQAADGTFLTNHWHELPAEEVPGTVRQPIFPASPARSAGVDTWAGKEMVDQQRKFAGPPSKPARSVRCADAWRQETELLPDQKRRIPTLEAIERFRSTSR